MSLTLHTFPTNFRAIKALVAAQYAGVDVNVPAFEMGKDNTTAEFLAKSPCGKVPVLDTKDGSIFGSNAITRYIARMRPDSNLNGNSFFETGQVDSWLDFCTNEVEVPATMWVYPILGYMEPNDEATKEAEKHLAQALEAMNTHLQFRTYFVGERVTLADICLFAALYYPLKFVMDKKFRKPYGNVVRWAQTCAAQAEFAAVVGTPMTLCNKREVVKGAKKAAPKVEKKVEKKEEPPAAPKEEPIKTIFGRLDKEAPSKMVIDTFKKLYSNTKDKMSIMPQFYDMYEDDKWSLWLCDYMYNDDNTVLWKASNGLGGFIDRCDSLRKWAFGTVQLLTKTGTAQDDEDGYASGKGNIFMRGAFLIRSTEGGKWIQRENPDAEYWKWTKVDLNNAEQKAALEERWANIYPMGEGGKIIQNDGLKLYDCQEFK